MKKIVLYIVIILSCSEIVFSQNPYSLEQCKKLAIEKNSKMKNSNLDVEIAKETEKEAFTNFFPSVSATGIIFNANKEMVEMEMKIPHIDPINLAFLKNGKMANVTAIQPLFTGGQIINGNKLAHVGVEVSELKVKLSENEVNQTTEKYFWQIVSLKEKLNTLSAVEAQLNEIHKNVKVAVQAGIATNNDLLKVELKQQSVESSRLKVENDLMVSKILLKQHIGIKDSIFDISFKEFPEIISPIIYYVNPENAVLYRTESKMLDKSIEVARLQKNMEIGKNLPTVALGASYVYHDLLDQNTDFGIVFATVSIPISSWWGGSHAIKRESLKQQQAQNTSQNAKEMMQVEIQAKWNELEEAYKQVLISDKSIVSAKENLRVSKDYYNAGVSSLSDLLDAQTTLQNSYDQRSEARTNYQTKLSDYLQITEITKQSFQIIFK